MQSTQQHIPLTIYPIVDSLARDTNFISKLAITHVFFAITLRRFICDT